MVEQELKKERKRERILYDNVRGEAYLERSGYVVGRLVELTQSRVNGNITLRTGDEELGSNYERAWIKITERSRLS